MPWYNWVQVKLIIMRKLSALSIMILYIQSIFNYKLVMIALYIKCNCMIFNFTRFRRVWAKIKFIIVYKKHLESITKLYKKKINKIKINISNLFRMAEINTEKRHLKP